MFVNLCIKPNIAGKKPLYLELSRHRQVASKLGANESLGQLEGFLQSCNIYIGKLIIFRLIRLVLLIQ